MTAVDGVKVWRNNISLTLYAPCIILQYVYKPTRCTKFLWFPSLRGLSPRANYTDRAAAARRQSYCQLLRVEGVAWSAQRVPTAVKLCFLDLEPLLFFYSSSSSIDLRRLTRLSGASMNVNSILIKRLGEIVELIRGADCSVRWRAVVNTVMNIPNIKQNRTFVPAEGLAA